MPAPDLFTATMIAKLYGVTACRVRQIAFHRQIVGDYVGDRLVYTRAQLPEFKLRPTGRPRKEKK